MCSRVDVCITRDIWKKLKLAMLDVLEKTTLECMVKMQKEKTKTKNKGMYYI
jgi:DNA-binding IscR family transcriptional regulator